jgi:hypothetical protein
MFHTNLFPARDFPPPATKVDKIMRIESFSTLNSQFSILHSQKVSNSVNSDSGGGRFGVKKGDNDIFLANNEVYSKK